MLPLQVEMEAGEEGGDGWRSFLHLADLAGSESVSISAAACQQRAAVYTEIYAEMCAAMSATMCAAMCAAMRCSLLIRHSFKAKAHRFDSLLQSYCTLAIKKLSLSPSLYAV